MHYLFENIYGKNDPVDPTDPVNPGTTDPETPVIDVPETLAEEPEVPLGDAPRTGDSSNAVPFVVLMMVAVAGLGITRRKFN